MYHADIISEHLCGGERFKGMVCLFVHRGNGNAFRRDVASVLLDHKLEGCEAVAASPDIIQSKRVLLVVRRIDTDLDTS